MRDRRELTGRIDLHVGNRLRLRRALMGISQERLGDALSLTFQQIQKYERGTNRIGASRLFEMACVLDVPVTYFFDGLPPEILEKLPNISTSGDFPERDAVNPDILMTKDTVDLIRAFYDIPDSELRRRIIDFLRTLRGAARPEAPERRPGEW